MSPSTRLSRLLRPTSGRASEYSETIWAEIAELIVQTFTEQMGVELLHEPMSSASLGSGLSLDVWCDNKTARSVGVGVSYRGIVGCELEQFGSSASASVSLFPYILQKKVRVVGADEFIEFRFDTSGPSGGFWGDGIWRAGEPGEFEYFEQDWGIDLD